MDVTGVSACLYCASGTFADETASTTSTACASGSSTVTLGTVIWNLSKSIWANELRFLHRWFLRPFVWTDCVRSMRAWVSQRPRGSENIVEEYALLHALWHISVGLKRTRDQKLSSGLGFDFAHDHDFSSLPAPFRGH